MRGDPPAVNSDRTQNRSCSSLASPSSGSPGPRRARSGDFGWERGVWRLPWTLLATTLRKKVVRRAKTGSSSTQEGKAESRRMTLPRPSSTRQKTPSMYARGSGSHIDLEPFRHRVGSGCERLANWPGCCHRLTYPTPRRHRRFRDRFGLSTERIDQLTLDWPSESPRMIVAASGWVPEMPKIFPRPRAMTPLEGILG